MPPAPWLSQRPLGGLLLWTVCLVLLGGFVMVIVRNLRRSKTGVRTSLPLAAASLLFLACALEGALRIHDRIRYGVPLRAPVALYVDEILGWAGRKEFGDPNAGRFKILVIGDSFTEGRGAPADRPSYLPASRLYYSVMARDLKAEVFAYGSGGYGTLQELMVLDRFVDEVQPDLVLLQFCSNDFMDNEWELGLESRFNTVLAVRPYLVGGRIEYRYPGRFGRPGLFLTAQSRLWYRLWNVLGRLDADLGRRGFLSSVENRIAEQGLSLPAFAAAARTTDTLLGHIKRRAEPVPIVVFTSIAGPPYDVVLGRICEAEGLPFLAGIPEAVTRAAQRGKRVRLPDGAHWSVQGHAVVGHALARMLVERGFVPVLS